MRIFSILFGLAFSLFMEVDSAAAQVSQLDGIVNFVITGTPLSSVMPLGSFNCPSSVGGGIGACSLAALFVYAVNQGRLLIGALAFITIIVAAFNLIIRQSEEALTTARRTVLGVVMGLFLIFTSEQFVDALYGGFSIGAREGLAAQ